MAGKTTQQQQGLGGIPKMELAKKLNLGINTLGRKMDLLGIKTVTDPLDCRVKRVSSKDLERLVTMLRVDRSQFEEFMK